jgi:hypothetical protein
LGAFADTVREAGGETDELTVNLISQPSATDKALLLPPQYVSVSCCHPVVLSVNRVHGPVNWMAAFRSSIVVLYSSDETGALDMLGESGALAQQTQRCSAPRLGESWARVLWNYATS